MMAKIAFNNASNDNAPEQDQEYTLIADIGGTNARFGLVDQCGNISAEKELLTADYKTFADAARHYFSLIDHTPKNGVIAWPGPVDKDSDTVRMTNGARWEISIKGTAKELGLEELHVMNDYVPQAYAAFAYKKSDYFQVMGEPVCDDGRDIKISVIGPGTGLGTINAERENGHIITIPAEGGHASMPYTSLADAQLLDVMQRKGLVIVAEKCVSGTGIFNIYEALCDMSGKAPEKKTPKEVTDAALKGTDATCVEAVSKFYYFLGVIAGNQVLVTGAKRLYLGGGILSKLGEDHFRQSRFFEGYLGNREQSHAGLLEQTQICIVTHPDPGRMGVVEYIKALRAEGKAAAPCPGKIHKKIYPKPPMMK